MPSVMVLQHEECEHLGLFSELLTRHNVAYRYVKLYEGESIPSPNDYSGVILLGGPMNVYDEEDHPFLKREDLLIRSTLKKGHPLLGICLGAQLIAKAADTKVYRGAQKEIGWYPVDLTAEGRRDPLLRGLGGRLAVFQWHGDTFDIPKDGVRLAGADLFPNQAFRIGAAGYALQFHLEVSYPMIRDWLERYSDELESLRGAVDPKAILRDSERYIADLNRAAEVLCENFVRLLR